MSNVKRFLSVILAMIFVLSTLVIGVSAFEPQYIDDKIIDKYNAICKPVLDTDQYANAAMDEVDRMLAAEDVEDMMITIPFIGATLDLTTVNNALNSVETIATGSLFKTAVSLVPALSRLKLDCFYAASGARRDGTGASDLKVIYSVFQFLNDNKDLVKDYINGQLISDLGPIGSLIPEEYTNVNMLLKDLMAKEAYTKKEREAPGFDPAQITLDTMVQKRVTDIIDEELWEDYSDEEKAQIIGMSGLNVPDGSDYTNMSIKAYDFIDNALKIVYNTIAYRELNRINFINNVKELCGVEVIEKVEDGKKTYEYNYDNVNGFYNIINVQDKKEFSIPRHTFTTDSVVSQANEILADLVNAIVNTQELGCAWSTEKTILDNVIDLAKKIIQYDEKHDLGLFASYIHRATSQEVEDMSDQQLVSYILRAILNGSVDGMYIPDSAQTTREVGFYALQQLLATSVPECDFTSLADDGITTDDLVVMGIDFAIYNINAELDMGLTYVMDMDGVNAQLKKASEYGVKNYGGLLNGIALDEQDSGWMTLDKIFFSILDVTWLPTCVTDAGQGNYFKTLLIDVLINHILDLDLEGGLALLENNHDGGLNDSAKVLVLNLAARIINIIFPEAINVNLLSQANPIEALAENNALANTVDKIFSDLYENRVNLAVSILPTLCDILDLTNEQKFKYPTYYYEDKVTNPTVPYTYTFSIMNNCTGINTAYRDASGNLHQDSLYKYRIDSITSGNTSVFTLSNNYAGQLIVRGQRLTVEGSFSKAGLAPITITYDILTEDGTELTESAISETIYVYLNKSAVPSPTQTKTSGDYTAVLPRLVYATSMSDLCDISVKVTNKSTTAQTVTPQGIPSEDAEYLPDTPISETYLKFADPQTVPAAMTATDGSVVASEANINIFETTDAYEALPDSEEDPEYVDGQPTKESVWKDIVELGYDIEKGAAVDDEDALNNTTQYDYDSFGVKVGTKAITTTTSFFTYSDFGAESMYSRELGKHRQPYDYDDASGALWTAYTSAMNTAALAVAYPFNGNFSSMKGNKYPYAAKVLKDAVTALEENAVGGGFDTVNAIIAQYHPDNKDDKGNKYDYDDPRYTYFGVSDFIPYTYYNYRTEEKAANEAYESTIDTGEEGKEPAVIDSLSVKNFEHRLTMMGSRLLTVEATKIHLVRELANATYNNDDNKYSEESWARYTKALAFANTVNNDTSTDLRQSKVNTAYEQLLEAEKRLVAPDQPGPGPDPEEFLPEDPEKGALPILEATDEGGTAISVLAGVTPGVNIANYFDSSVCDVVVTPNESGKVTTNATVEVKDKSGSTVATYVLAYSGDINLDGACGDSFDLPVSARNGSGAIVLKGATGLAGDLNNDGNADSFDLPIFARAASGAIVIDYYNRCAK